MSSKLDIAIYRDSFSWNSHAIDSIRTPSLRETEKGTADTRISKTSLNLLPLLRRGRDSILRAVPENWSFFLGSEIKGYYVIDMYIREQFPR